MSTFGRGGAGNVSRVLEINEGVQLVRERAANRLSTKPVSVDQAFAGDSVYTNYGRGGAGNKISKSDASSIATYSTSGSREIPLVPRNNSLSQPPRPATAAGPSYPPNHSYRPVGRGGAGNFHPEAKAKAKAKRKKEAQERSFGRGNLRAAVDVDARSKESSGSRNGFWSKLRGNKE